MQRRRRDLGVPRLRSVEHFTNAIRRHLYKAAAIAVAIDWLNYIRDQLRKAVVPARHEFQRCALIFRLIESSGVRVRRSLGAEFLCLLSSHRPLEQEAQGTSTCH